MLGSVATGFQLGSVCKLTRYDRFSTPFETVSCLVAESHVLQTRVDIPPHATLSISEQLFGSGTLSRPHAGSQTASHNPCPFQTAFQPFSLSPRNRVGQRLGNRKFEPHHRKAFFFWNFDLARVGAAEERETQKSWLVRGERALNVHLTPVRIRQR